MRARPVRRLLLSVPLLGAAAPALAQPSAAPTAPASPHFPTLGPDGGGNDLEAQLALSFFEGELSERVDLGLELDGDGGTGGYARVAATHLDGTTAAGAVELGATHRRPGATSDLTFRLGLILPTISDEGDDAAHHFSTIVVRPSDVLTAIPQTTTLRLAVQPTWRADRLVARADVGLDVVVATQGDVPDLPFLRADLGVGYLTGRGAIVAELTSYLYLDEPDDSVHVAALTGELTAGSATPYVTVSTPFQLGDGGRLDVTNVVVGVRSRR